MSSNPVKTMFNRYFVDAMSYMAMGLFSSLIIGLIMSQLAQIPFLAFLAPFAEIINASSPVVGGAIGAAIALGLRTKPLVIFSCVAAGAFGYQVGGPVGAYIGGVIGAEVGNLVAGKTKVDIIVTPIVTITSGCFVAGLAGPGIQSFMEGLGQTINMATTLAPLPMGVAVAVIVGMVLTAPISSAALCIMLGLEGLAAGAACVGCACQMVGFAAASFDDNGFGGLLSQGIGTSMLQFANIMRRPQIWIAPTLASALLGPVSTVILKMENTAVGAGMGTSGLVGQFGAYAAMSGSVSTPLLLAQIVGLHFIAPAILTIIFHRIFLKLGWVRRGDMKLQQL